ncbi:MAG: hypothetical protein V1743_01865 [Nanoarchaeota archaeon]
MNTQIQINSQTFRQLGDYFQALFARILAYFNGCTRFQQYAWILIGAGFLLVILALIIW